VKTVLAILSCLAGALCALGQGVSVQLVLDQDQYLAGETLPAKVRVSNFSGHPLHLGKEADWLTFWVQDAQHLEVSRQDMVPVAGEFTLEPSMTGTKRVDLAPYFDLTQAGRYYVSAVVTVPELRQTLQSKAVAFDIINGSSIWEQEFGVPGTAQDGALPEVRHYALIETLHSKTIKLYFRLSGARQSRIYRVYPLGTMVSFSNPEPQLDKFNNLHVLYQTGARIFQHCLVNPDGILIARESYEITSTRPVLHAEKDGRVTVSGGVRRSMPTDLPPPYLPSVQTAPQTNAKSNRP
jgi:hypothetical protein